MDEELRSKIEAQDVKLEAIYRSSEKMRKYFLWTFWLTVAFFVLPLIGMIFVIPFFMSSYVGSLSLDGGGSDTQNMLDHARELQDLLQ